jgi:hypothetical protein
VVQILEKPTPPPSEWSKGISRSQSRKNGRKCEEKIRNQKIKGNIE